MKKGKVNVKLFIADDSDLVRKRLSMLLSQLDNVEIVGLADTVQRAINGIQRANPDVVVLDVKMPGGCGIDVLEHIRRSGPGPVVIVLTNYPYPQYKHRCIDAGADFFFDKSQEFELAIQAIKKLASDSSEEIKPTLSSGGGNVMTRTLYQHPFKSIPSFTEKRRTEQKEVNLEEVIRNIQILLPDHVNETIETRLVLADQELPVMIDMAQIGLAILNLIRNAWEAMPAGGSLTIQTGSAKFPGNAVGKGGRTGGKDFAIISVSDTGAGMDEKTLSRIFEPYYTTKEGAYRGMGLPIAYHTIKRHSGSINIESRPGHGTTVKIYLPLLGKAPARRKAIPLPPATAYGFIPRVER